MVDEEPSGIEARVKLIWQQLLGVEDISRESNFFDLGGDSVLVSMLLSRLDDEFELYVDGSDLYSAPTLGELVQLVKAALADQGLDSDA